LKSFAAPIFGRSLNPKSAAKRKSTKCKIPVQGEVVESVIPQPSNKVIPGERGRRVCHMGVSSRLKIQRVAEIAQKKDSHHTLFYLTPTSE
jgi:hypothetical protein